MNKLPRPCVKPHIVDGQHPHAQADFRAPNGLRFGSKASLGHTEIGQPDRDDTMLPEDKQWQRGFHRQNFERPQAGQRMVRGQLSLTGYSKVSRAASCGEKFRFLHRVIAGFHLPVAPISAPA